MALIMYFTKAPKYKDTTIEEIELISSYLDWEMAKTKGACKSKTLKEWCGISEKYLPDVETIEYYKQFFTKKHAYIDGIGDVNSFSLFEQSARIVKANQILNWFMVNIMSNKPSQSYFEVSEEMLKKLLDACVKVKNGINVLENDNYLIDEKIAEEYLPLLKERGYSFGPDKYNNLYAIQVIEMVDILTHILKTTNFKNEAIYFNATW